MNTLKINFNYLLISINFISMIRYKLINDLVEISFYFNYEINKITIMNNILFDVYKVQKNIVLINYKSKINSYIFSR